MDDVLLLLVERFHFLIERLRVVYVNVDRARNMPLGVLARRTDVEDRHVPLLPHRLRLLGGDFLGGGRRFIGPDGMGNYNCDNEHRNS